MPARLLNALEKSEIFDLLAYLVADGNEKHPGNSSHVEHASSCGRFGRRRDGRLQDQQR
jgi:hypothetical protein